jgi:transposase
MVRLELMLEDASIKLSTVASSLKTVSARAILAAMIDGETDARVLAEMAKGRMRKKIPDLAQALEGHFDANHAQLARSILDRLDRVEQSLAELDHAIEAACEPWAHQIELLLTIPGVGPRVAQTIVAETGADMSQFPTAAHLASWAGMAPGTNITGGKRQSGKTTPGDVWLRDILTQCAWSATRSRDTYLSAQFWRLARRIGKKKAAIAVGHSILVICWSLLTNNCDYDDLGGDYFTKRANPDRQRDRLIAQLHELGYQVTLKPAA